MNGAGPKAAVLQTSCQLPLWQQDFASSFLTRLRQFPECLIETRRLKRLIRHQLGEKTCQALPSVVPRRWTAASRSCVLRWSRSWSAACR